MDKGNEVRADGGCLYCAADQGETHRQGCTKPSQGPWNLVWWGNEQYPYPLSILADNDGEWVARDGTVSSVANARLIAAAPDMLEALKAASGYLLNAKIDLETGAPKKTAITTIEGGLKVITAAIAKAHDQTQNDGKQVSEKGKDVSLNGRET